MNRELISPLDVTGNLTPYLHVFFLVAATLGAWKRNVLIGINAHTSYLKLWMMELVEHFSLQCMRS